MYAAVTNKKGVAVNKQKKIAIGATALLLVLTILYLAVLRPLLARYQAPKEPPAELLEGESYYQVGDTVYDQMVVMYDQLRFSDMFQIVVHNNDGEEYLFYHYQNEGRNYFYMGQYLDEAYDEGGRPSFYMPDIAQSFAGFDYTTLYDGQEKIPALLSAVGAVVIEDRVYRWDSTTDPTRVQEQLHRYGLAEQDDAPWFEVTPYLTDRVGNYIYALPAADNHLTGEEDLIYYDPASDAYYHVAGVRYDASAGYSYDPAYRYTGQMSALSPAADPDASRRVYVGSATADDSGYYVMLEGRGVVYTTATVTTNMGSVDLANLVDRSMSYYVHPRLLTASYSPYDPFYTPYFALSGGTLKDQPGETVGEGDRVYFSYAATPTQREHQLYRMEVDDLLSELLVGLAVGQEGFDLLSATPRLRAIMDGDTVTYTVDTILAVYDKANKRYHTSDVTVGADSLVLVRYGDGETRTVSSALGSYEEPVWRYGMLDMADPDMPASLRNALLGQPPHTMPDEANYIKTPILYTQNEDMTRAEYRISSLDAIVREGVAPGAGETARSGDTVTFTYTLYLDGTPVSTVSSSMVLDTEAKDPVTRALTQAMIGKEAGKGTASAPYTTATLYYTEDALMWEYEEYLSCEIRYTVSDKTELAFGYFYYTGDGQKDIYQSDSIYLITAPEELRMYSIESTVAQTVLHTFTDLVAEETVAVGITPEVMEHYGLYAHTLSYTLPYNTKTREDDKGNVLSITTDDVIEYLLFISEPDGNGARYVASQQFDTVTRVTDGRFDFVDWDFLTGWARGSLLLTDIANLKDLTFRTNFSDLEDTWSYALTHDHDFRYSQSDGSVGVTTKTYVAYVNGLVSHKTHLDDTKTTRVGPGVYVETFSDTQRVTTVVDAAGNKASDLDAIYARAGYTGTNRLDGMGVYYFRRMLSSLYSVRYMGLVSEDMTEAEADALLANEAATVLTLSVTLTDGRVYTYRFYAYSARRCMVSVAGRGADGSDLGETHRYYVNRTEVVKLADMAAMLSAGQDFSTDGWY